MARTTATDKVQTTTMIMVLKTTMSTAHRTAMVLNRTAANLAKTLKRSWPIFTTKIITPTV